MATEGTVLERRPKVLEQQPGTITPEQQMKLIEKIYTNLKGRDNLADLPFELIVSQLDHDDAAALLPLAFNQKVAAGIFGDGYEPVLKEMFQHVVEFVAKTTDPGTWQSFVSLISNPIVARQIWGSSYKQHLRQLATMILEDIPEGQKHTNGHRR